MHCILRLELGPGSLCPHSARRFLRRPGRRNADGPRRRHRIRRPARRLPLRRRRIPLPRRRIPSFRHRPGGRRKPDPRIGQNVTAESAHISGTIDPEGGSEDAVAGLLPIQWELQLNKDGEGWNTVGSGELSTAEPEGGGTPPAASDSPIAVEAESTGLVPNSHYQFRLVAHHAGLQEETPEVEWGAFDTPAIGPAVVRSSLMAPTSTSIRLNAQVDPNNAALTDCHFEYGLNGALDQIAQCEALPSGPSGLEGPQGHEEELTQPLPDGDGFKMVSANIANLAPANEYDFRLVATSSAGTTEGEVRSFTALEAVAPQACPNEEIRRFQKATGLPDCRAYEMVSPLMKGNADIVAGRIATQASREGDRVTYAAHAPFGDTLGSQHVGQTRYLAQRTPSGWSSRGITPAPNPLAAQVTFSPTWVRGFSDDLGTAVWWAYDLPYVANDVPDAMNAYVQNTTSREIEAVTIAKEGLPNPKPHFSEFREQYDWGISADAKHLAIVSQGRFVAEAASGPEVTNVYQWDEGNLTLAGILPDGSTPRADLNLRRPVISTRSPMTAADSCSWLRTAGQVSSTSAWTVSVPSGFPNQSWLVEKNPRAFSLKQPTPTDESSFSRPRRHCSQRMKMATPISTVGSTVRTPTLTPISPWSPKMATQVTFR